MLDLFLERQRRKLLRVRPKTRLQLMTTIATVVFFGLVGITLLTGLLFAWYAKDLPRPDKVNRTVGFSTVILDRTGEPLYDVYEDQNRLPVKWENIPQYLKDATIAVEDKDFYKHQGLSTTGILRAFLSSIFLGQLQGGSTLTQQLVKNVLLTNERTLPRKIKEAILAIQIERKYTKDEILRMYLNEAPYGGATVGVESAAQYYYDKPLKNLTLVESAILAGLPQSPNSYSPFGQDPKAYVARTEHVLRRMREDGVISPIQETEARKLLPNVAFAKGDTGLRAPHFVAYIKDLLVKKFGQNMVDAGLKVTTTLDWKLQEKAQQIVADEVTKAKYLKVSNGAAVVLDPKTGEILAMVGSKDYAATDSSGFKFNVVTQALRQPGSAIKPITYAAAFKKGYTASTLLMDVDTKYPSGDPAKPEYDPKNYDGKFRGPMQLRFALGNSINTIAVKVSALVGVKDVLSTAFDMGLTTLEPTDENLRRFGLSLTLGGGEVHLLDLASAYGVFATGGLRQDPVALLKVEDSKGSVLYEYKPTKGRRVLPENISFLISDILSDNNARKEEFGANSYLFISGRSVAAKTGTTDDKRDNWTFGYTPSVVVGTWVGNNDNSPMNPALASGITGAAPIWNRIMRTALTNLPNEQFAQPPDVVQMDIDAFGGGLPVDGSATRKEFFIKGTEPVAKAPVYADIKVSKRDNNKLANPVEVARNEYDLKTYIVIREQDPVSTDGKNRWQEAIDAWVGGQGDSKFHPPSETYQGNDQIGVSIKEPGDHTEVDTNDVKVRVEIGTSNNITKVEIQVDGTVVKTEPNNSTFTDTVHMTSGQHTISVRASDDKGNSSQADVHIGVNQPYATPTPTPTLAPTPTP